MDKKESGQLAVLVAALGTAIGLTVAKPDPRVRQDGSTLTHVDVSDWIDRSKPVQPGQVLPSEAPQQPVQPPQSGQQSAQPDQHNQQPPAEFAADVQVAPDLSGQNPPTPDFFQEGVQSSLPDPTIQSSDSLPTYPTQPAAPTDVPTSEYPFHTQPQLTRESATSQPTRTLTAEASFSQELTMEQMTTIELMARLKDELDMTVMTSHDFYPPAEHSHYKNFVDLNPSALDDVLKRLLATTILRMPEQVQRMVEEGRFTVVIQRLIPNADIVYESGQITSGLYISDSKDGVLEFAIPDLNLLPSSPDTVEDRMPSGLTQENEAEVAIYEGVLTAYFYSGEGKQKISGFLNANQNFGSLDPMKRMAIITTLGFHSENYPDLEEVAARIYSLRGILKRNLDQQLIDLGLNVTGLSNF